MGKESQVPDCEITAVVIVEKAFTTNFSDKCEQTSHEKIFLKLNVFHKKDAKNTEKIFLHS